MPNFLNRTPPCSPEAEQAVLGSMLIDPETIPCVSETLTAEDFYIEGHKIIFKTILSLYSTGKPVDMIILDDELKKSGHLEKIGGTGYIALLLETVPTVVNIHYYAETVKTKSLLRNIIKAGAEITKMAYREKENKNIDFITDHAENLFFQISERRSIRDFIGMKTAMKETFKEIEHLYHSNSSITGVPTGFTDLDRLTSGFHPRELIIIAARPGMGKTAFAIDIARHAALEEKLPIAVFSLEMSAKQLSMRLICGQAMVNAHRIRTGHLKKGDWPKITQAMAEISESPIIIDDTPGISIAELRAKARRAKKRHRIKLLIVDYLQLISSEKNVNRNEQISEISRGLKILAKETDTPVIALSQLSRSVEARTDKRPLLSDLRDSGAIEQDADLVSFIYRDEYYNSETDETGTAEIIIAKQRSGPTGKIDLLFIKEYTKFVNKENYYVIKEASF